MSANLLKGNHQKANYLGVPSVVFTIPPLAAVGLSERGAREQNLKFRVRTEMTPTWYSSRRVAETYSGYKVLVEEGTGARSVSASSPHTFQAEPTPFYFLECPK